MKLSARYVLPPSHVDLFDDALDNIASRCSQRAFTAVFNCEMWLNAKDECDTFDAANATAVVPHREATRLVSCAQIGAGAHLARHPDPALRGSVIASADFLTRIQRRLGLYVSCLRPALDERLARGLAVTQHDRLGDSYVNAAHHGKRHNDVLAAIAAALRATTPAGTILQGDKGDGTTASRAEAAQRYKFLNDGHIPDLYRLGPPHTIWELKCLTPFFPSGALGRGSARCGGAASTTDGHSYAFGCTLENQISRVLGLKARGDPNGRQLDRTTGEGYVAARDGDYADAMRKGNAVHLLLVEATGAISPALHLLLCALAAASKTPEAGDSTCYGKSRAATTSFYVHHTAAISAAAVAADSRMIRTAAQSLSRSLLAPPPALAPAPAPALAPVASVPA